MKTACDNYHIGALRPYLDFLAGTRKNREVQTC